MTYADREHERNLRGADILHRLDATGALKIPRLLQREATSRAIASTLAEYGIIRCDVRTYPDPTPGLFRDLRRADLRLRRSPDSVTINDTRTGLLMEVIAAANKRQVYRQAQTTLILALAGILRATVRDGDWLGYLPGILKAGGVRSTRAPADRGAGWTTDGLEKRLKRHGGMSAADLAAIVPMFREPALRELVFPFVMLEKENGWHFVLLKRDLQRPKFRGLAFKPRGLRQVPDADIERFLLRSDWPSIHRRFGQLGIPYLSLTDEWGVTLAERFPDPKEQMRFAVRTADLSGLTAENTPIRKHLA